MRVTFRLLAWIVSILALAAPGWIGLVVFLVARDRLLPISAGLTETTLIAMLAAAALLGTWGAIALRPRRRASAVAVDEFRRRRQRTPTG